MAYIGSPPAPKATEVDNNAVESVDIQDGAVTSAKLDTNIAVDGNLTVDTNTLYVDATNNRVGIGTASPSYPLHTAGSGSVVGVGNIGTELKLQNASTVSDAGSGSGFASDGSTASVGAWVGPITFYSGNNGTTKLERVRIDSSGNVGIGTSSPTNTLQVIGNIYATTTVRGNGGNSASSPNIAVDGGTGMFRPASNTVGFTTNNTERARITSSGNWLVNRTASSSSGVVHELNFSVSSQIGIRYHMTDTTYNNAVIEFKRSDGTRVGYIYANGSSTSYNTSSDYRLKEDWQPMTGASERVKALNPVNFAWKDDGSRVDGFLAHEAQEVVPEAVTGTKDEVDDDGNPKYQGIDQSKLVPLLTAALQEAITKIESLEARVATLESA